MKPGTAGLLLLSFAVAVGVLAAAGLSKVFERRERQTPPSAPPPPAPRAPERARAPKKHGILHESPPPDVDRFDVPAEAPPIPLPGRVLDDRDRPVAGAILVWGRTHAPRDLWERVTADEHGGFVILLGAEDVRVEARVEKAGVLVAAGASAVSWSSSVVRCGTRSMTIRVGPSTVVRGVCVDPSGGAVPGVSVAIGGFEALPVTTAADGSFEFPPLALAGLRGFVAGWRPADDAVFGEFDPARPDREPIRIELPWRIDVRARIRDAAGEPVVRWMSPGGYPEDSDDRSVAVWRGVTSPGRIFVTERDAQEPATAEIAFTGGDPLLDLGEIRLSKVWPAHITAEWADGERIEPSQVHRKVPGEVRFAPLEIDAKTGATVVPVGGGTAIVAIRAARRPDPSWGLPEAFLVTGTLDVAVAPGDDLSLRVEPDTVLVLRATWSGGGSANFAGGLRVSTGVDFGASLPVTVQGGLAAVNLTGRPPWHLTVRSPGSAPVAVDILEARPRIDRDVVLR